MREAIHLKLFRMIKGFNYSPDWNKAFGKQKDGKSYAVPLQASLDDSVGCLCYASYCHFTHTILMLKSHLRNGNRLCFYAYLWIRCWKGWFTFDTLQSTYAVTEELDVGLGSPLYITFSRPQVDVLSILHETTSMPFSRNSQGSVMIIRETTFLLICRGLLPLVAETLVIFSSSKQHHAEHKLQWTSASFCPSISQASESST